MKVYYKNFWNLIYKNKIRNVFQSALNENKINIEGLSVTITIVDEDTIKNLNTKFRDVDKVTDVLSFPNFELNKGKNINLSNLQSGIDRQTGLISLGDIIICKKVAKLQAKAYNHSYKREICFLALHGFLHILGYDHLTDEDEIEMNTLSEKLLLKNRVERK